MNKPTIRQLEYVLAVAKYKSFHKAAEACFVSQPTLSAQVKNLETNLQVTIFERNNRSVSITAAGEEILRYAQITMNDVDDLMQKSKNFGEPLSSTLRLGVIPTIAPYLLPQVMPIIYQTYPKLKLLIREEQTHQLLRKLHEGKLDVLLLALEADLGSVHTEPLFTDPFYCTLYNEHPLAKRKVVTPKDLFETPMLLLEEGHCLRDQIWDFCKPAGAHVLGDFSATSLNTLMQMVSNKLGITLLPKLALDLETKQNTRVCAKKLVPVPKRTVGLAWNKHSLREQEFMLLHGTLKKALT